MIYALREPGTRNVRYIGKSSAGLSRPRSHWNSKKYLNDGYPVHLWTKKLVESCKKPDVLILREFSEDLSREERNEILSRAEMQEIALHREAGHELLNMTDGGDGLSGWVGEKHPMFGRRGPSSPRFGKKHSAESRKKMSEGLSGVHHPNYGKRLKDETRQKIGTANLGSKNGMFGKTPPNKGVPFPEDLKENLREKCGRRVTCVNDGLVFRSQVEAAKHYGISRNTVGQSCNGRIKSTRDGLTFRFFVEEKP